MPRPTVRVLTVLELLQSRPQISGAALAEAVGVDRRTLRRYISALEDLGIPIATEQGRFGGYRLVPGFKLPPLIFTEDEAQAVALGLLAAHRLGLSATAPAIASAQAKLDRVLPDTVRQASTAVRDQVTLSVEHINVPADPRRLRVLAEAAQARRTVELEYRAADQRVTRRRFDVYGLVFRAGRWFVVGHCRLRQGLRVLRADRIDALERVEEHFEKPHGFDAEAHLTQAFATMPRAVTVEVVLHTDLRSARREVHPMLGTLEVHGDGVRLCGTSDDLEWFARQLVALPFTFDVVAPREIRDVFSQIARQLDRIAVRA